MLDLSSAELEVASLMIESLALEDITATEILPDYALFSGSLGLDSFDANTPGAYYAAAKAGIIGSNKYLSLEVVSRDITINAIAPGIILEKND